MSRYFIYCRKSSEAEDRQVLSVDSQIDEANRIAAQRGLSTELFTEAKSAKEPGRPIFTSMLERLERGEARGIITWKADRLARNPVDGGRLIWAMKQRGFEIITPTQVFRADDDSLLLLYLEFGMAHKFINDLSRNIRRGNRAKLERGGWPNRAPQGYMNDRLARTVINDADRFPLIRQAWDLLLSEQHPVVSIWKTLNNEWGYRTGRGTSLALSALYKIFTNPFYFGQMERKEGVFHGNHQPMITEDEFWRAQAILGKRGRRRPKGRSFPFTGLIRCGACNRMLTAEAKVNRFGSRYIYYHCSARRVCKEPSIEARALETQIADYLDRLTLSPSFVEWVSRYLEDSEAQDVARRQTIAQTAEATIADLQKQLTTLTGLRTRSLITDQEFTEERHRLRDQLATLIENRSPQSAISAGPELATFATFVFAAQARASFHAGGSAAKRAILEMVASNPRLSGRTLSIEAKTPFLALERHPNLSDSNFEPIEPASSPDLERLLTTPWRSRAQLWCIVEDVRTYFATEPSSATLAEQFLAFLEEHGVLRRAS